MLRSVTLISISDPVIAKFPFSNIIPPSESPKRKLPSPSIKIPLPVAKLIKSASGPIANVGVPLPSIIILPCGLSEVCPKLIEDSFVDIWMVDADTSSLRDANSIVPPSNFIKSVAFPTWNSGSVLLFANQNPAVVDVADVLPVAIYP